MKCNLLGIIKNLVQAYCQKYAKENSQRDFVVVEAISPSVDVKSCFDDLRVPANHVSRRISDTYYINENMVHL